MPKKFSAKHFLLVLWISAGTFVVSVIAHNAIYGLFGIEEAVFFCIAIFLVPAGFIVGVVGRIWGWCVVKPIEEMNAKGTQIPTTWPYFVPIGSYIWLWKFCKGIRLITDGRLSASGAFCLAFFLGILGMVIIRVIIRRTLSRVAA